MIVKTTLMALVRRPDKLPREFEKEIKENTTVNSFLSDLGYSSQEIRVLQVFVSSNNDTGSIRVPPDYILKNNDELFITIPVGGG
ncbi:MAG: hypothetical protein ACFFBD_14055 [Candidatus Hodarchaeota archaeon]